MSTIRGFSTRISVITAAAIAAASVALAGCGGNSAPTSTVPGTGAAATTASTAAPSTAHNQADITFVQDMIPHHQQAVAMAKMVANHGASTQVTDLAGRIEAAQQPEIDHLNGFLRAWNAPVSQSTGSSMNPTHGMPGMSGMDHSQDNSGPGGTSSMPGMMSGGHMQQRGQANGPAFDKMFLQMMIGHHQVAVTMSQTELAHGQNPDAKALAHRIIDAQQREITEMRTMLGG
jgi:uncharacterized protein (DUF305 family)